MMALAQATIQNMPEHFSRQAITVLQPASTTPEPTNRPSLRNSGSASDARFFQSSRPPKRVSGGLPGLRIQSFGDALRALNLALVEQTLSRDQPAFWRSESFGNRSAATAHKCCRA